MSAAADLRAAAATRILIKDGPYGTAIQNYGLAEADYRGDLAVTHDQKGNNDLLNLTRPDIVAAICDSYLDAGADIVATNTFNATRISQGDYGLEARVPEINRAAARIVRDCADAATARDGRPRWVAGACGPTNKTLSISPRVSDPGYREVDFDGVKSVYREQIDALLEGGVDIVLIETVFDTLNAKAAAMAAMEAGDDFGARGAGHAVDDADRPRRAQPQRPDGRGVLAVGAARLPVERGSQLLVRRNRTPSARRGAVARRRYAADGLSQRRAAQRHGRLR